MNKTQLVILGSALLCLGGLIGYSIGRDQEPAPVAMPDNMHSMMVDMNAGLRGKTGDDFDKAFIDEMTVHHQGAIDMANLVLTTSQRQELLELARNIITAQSNEIVMMKEWRQNWF